LTVTLEGRPVAVFPLGDAQEQSVQLELRKLFAASHHALGVQPKAGPVYKRQLLWSARRFIETLRLILRCAGVTSSYGMRGCSGAEAVGLYEALANVRRVDAELPAALWLQVLFAAPAGRSTSGSVYWSIRNPLLAAIGVDTVSCHPVPLFDDMACMIEPRTVGLSQ
jgi:hypothetical protein